MGRMAADGRSKEAHEGEAIMKAEIWKGMVAYKFVATMEWLGGEPERRNRGGEFWFHKRTEGT